MRQSLRCRGSGHKCAGQELAAQSCRTRTLAIAVGGEGDWKAQSRDGGSRQSAAVEAGLKQGFAGWSGHGCGRGRWLRASLGGGKCKVAFWLTPSPAYIEPTWAAEGSLGTFRWFREFGQLAFLHFKNFKL